MTPYPDGQSLTPTFCSTQTRPVIPFRREDAPSTRRLPGVARESCRRPSADVGCTGVAGVQMTDAFIDLVLDRLSAGAPSIDERLLHDRQNEWIVSALRNQDRRRDERTARRVVR